MLPTAQPKPRPRLLEQRERQAAIDTIDRQERVKCAARSGGRCEVWTFYGRPHPTISDSDRAWYRRCERRASENHHLIGGSGRRNKGRSILAAHRLHVCTRCHTEITGKVLIPIDGTQAEDAATVQYKRRRRFRWRQWKVK